MFKFFREKLKNSLRAMAGRFPFKGPQGVFNFREKIKNSLRAMASRSGKLLEYVARDSWLKPRLFQHIPAAIHLNELPHKVIDPNFDIPQDKIAKIIEPLPFWLFDACGKTPDLAAFRDKDTDPNAPFPVLFTKIQKNILTRGMLSHELGWIEKNGSTLAHYIIIETNKESANNTFQECVDIIETARSEGKISLESSKILYSFLTRFK